MKLTRTTGTVFGISIAAIAALLLTPTLISGERPTTPAAQTMAPTVSPEAPSPASSYSRDLFGPRWADVDRNGCDTRNDVLKRDLVDVVFKAGTHDCVVLSGTLHDPLTGETVSFTRKSSGYQPVQIDHIVPLAVAWSSGAAS
ncbi:HNH endonuclease family protein [Microbacterium testaceum]|uniref:HNH endonuclease family protein n=1 Tax=Microbacterium testaceum TaxID=2033 RepID=UPI002AC5C2B3|nr:HNH endonuclease family protein [Microbacterium testaceum]MDZ5146301.1 HNH endonuclease family protein [Microbacterium testaceum]